MSQAMELIIAARNTTDAAFKQMQAGLGQTEAQIKKLIPSTDAWSAAQQRATMRMAGMHDEALKMNSALTTSSSNVSALGQAFGLATNPLVILGGLVTGFAAGLASATSKLIETAGAVSDLSAKTGIGVEALQTLKHAGSLVGVSMEDVSGAIVQMNKRLVDTPEAFAKVGLSAERLKNMRADEAFALIAEKIQSIQNPAEQTSAAMQLLGRTGVQVLPLLKSDIAAATDEAERFGLVLSGETIAAADALGDRLTTLGAAWDALQTQTVAALATSETLADALDLVTLAIGNLAKKSEEGREERTALIDDLLQMTQLGKVIAIASALASTQGTPTSPNRNMPSDAPEIDFGKILVEGMELSERAIKDADKALEQFNREQERAAKAARAAAQAYQDMLSREGRIQIASNTLAWGRALEIVRGEITSVTVEVDDLTAAGLRQEEEVANLAESTAKAWGLVDEAAKSGARFTENALKLGDALRALPGILDQLGVSADSALGQLAEGFAGAAEGAMALFAGLASGNPAQIIQGIAGIGHAMKGLSESTNGWVRAAGIIINAPLGLAGLIFGGGGPTAADRLNHDLMIMRTEFINSAGGLVALEAAAAAAGVSLDAMWNARTVEEYEAAVNRVNAAIALHESAVDQTREAMERWGLTAADMGPEFAKGLLHEQFAQIYTDLMLLEAAGANVGQVLGSDFQLAIDKGIEAGLTAEQAALAAIAASESMGASINLLVQQSLEAGVALPSSMEPFIQKLIDMGLLFDETGAAITDVSNQTFTETLEAGVTRLIAKVEELVDSLLGVPRKIEVEWAYKVTGPRPPGVPGGPPIPGEPGDGPAEHAHGGFIERDRDWEMPGTGGGQLAIVHPGELVIPAGSDFSNVMAALTGRGRGRRDSADAAIAELTAAIKQQGSPVQVNVAVPVDGSTVPSAHRQQFIEGVGDEVARGFLAGGRNYRTILRAIRSANAQAGR